MNARDNQQLGVPVPSILDQLEKKRQGLKKSKGEFARLLQINKSQYSRALSRGQRLPKNCKEKVAEVLGIDPSKLPIDWATQVARGSLVSIADLKWLMKGIRALGPLSINTIQSLLRQRRSKQQRVLR